MIKKKTWKEKLEEKKDLPKVVTLDEKAQARWGGKTMMIPSPMEVNNIMAKVPKGEIITIDQIRKTLAKKYKTDIACPLTTGIFSWIAAHAAEEQHSSIPWWRTIKTDGSLNEKYPGGTEIQKKLLESEGHKIIKKGKKYFLIQ